jgi:hypothetical protein
MDGILFIVGVEPSVLNSNHKLKIALCYLVLKRAEADCVGPLRDHVAGKSLGTLPKGVVFDFGGATIFMKYEIFLPAAASPL